MKIGFAILVSDPLFGGVIDIENAFHDRAGFFDRLSQDGNLPHTTLFQGEMRDDINFEVVADAIENHIVHGSQRTMQFTHISYVPEGWYFLDCVKTQFLTELHMLTLEMVKPFIILDENRMKRNTSSMPQNQIYALEKYGYRYSETAFYPHITIGRNNGCDEVLLNDLNESFQKLNLCVPMKYVTVYKMGNNGTHSQTLYKRCLI